MTGFLHLNVAETWPDFTLGPEVINVKGSLRLKASGSGFFRSGAFVGGPITVGSEPAPWFRLRAFAGALAEDEHLELFTYTADLPPPTPALSDATPFPQPTWRAAPRDLLDVVIPGPAARQLWIGGVLRGDGTSSPHLDQLRVDYGRATAIASLPAIYSREPDPRERLERLLALHESPLRELDDEIRDLVRLMDPASAPAGGFPSWLSWLAGWLDFDLVNRWSEAETRELLASAFELYGARGTIEGLRRYLKIYAGVEARISEPEASTVVWSLGQSSSLGFTTRLAAASPQGAVLDSSATLDASHLSRGDHFGEPLFEDVAHRFCVEVYCADLRRPGALDDVRATLDREKPAHTVYTLRVIGPRLRLGIQSRLGVDAIVGRRDRFAHLGATLGAGTLGGSATPCRPVSTEP